MNRAGTWGPCLIGAYGLGLIMAGIFLPGPGLGFPPGAPAGMPSTISRHALLHGVGSFLAFVPLTAACLATTRLQLESLVLC
jgi:uncharacterized protein DUF998